MSGFISSTHAEQLHNINHPQRHLQQTPKVSVYGLCLHWDVAKGLILQYCLVVLVKNGSGRGHEGCARLITGELGGFTDRKCTSTCHRMLALFISRHWCPLIVVVCSDIKKPFGDRLVQPDARTHASGEHV